jgi:multidrug efflux pump subunit AcrB
MPIVLAALRRPFTVLVAVVAVLFGSGLAIRDAPVDIFPALDVPVVYVVQPYAGMAPTQMEGQLVSYYEYHFLYVAGVEHVESQSVQGIGLIRVYFHPGTDVAQAMAQITAMAFRSIAFMPAGTLPPFMVRFDAGSIPVAQLVFSSETRTEAEVQDLALNQVRPLLATLPGVSAPPPSGGRVRTIVAYVDPERMRSYGLSPDEIATAIGRGNPVIAAGNIRVGSFNNILDTNAIVTRPTDLGEIPLRTDHGATVFLRDVARVEDSADVVYNVALVNGRRTVYMPVTKRADASTLEVIRAVREALPRMRALVPDDVHIDLEFDQSSYVERSIRGLVEEGALGALLTSIMVLLFLRDLRSALIVVVTIPTSVLAAVVALRLLGQTINVMTLSGLALSVGILVDEATVAIENVHTHLARGTEPRRAIVHAMREVTLPRLLAMLCVLSVFIPVFFVHGIAASLFPPLALAVALAMIASYFASTALVPVLSVWLLGRRAHAVESVGAVRSAYRAAIARIIAARWVLVPLYVAGSMALIVQIAPTLATELFPRVDADQLQLRIRAPAGTRVERTTAITRDVERIVREEAGSRGVRIALANIGNPAWTYPVNAVYVFNAGPHEATLLVALGGARSPSVFELETRVRERVMHEMPDVRVSFEAGDVVSQVMNLGAPAPVHVTVTGRDLRAVRAHAERIEHELLAEDALDDVQIPIALDYPAVHVEIDRDLAGQHAVTVDRIARTVVAATASSVLTTPIFWTDPATGQPYRIALRVPEAQLRSASDLLSLPIARADDGVTTALGDVATVYPTTMPGEVDRWNNQRTVSISANVRGRDLAGAARRVRAAIARAGDPPRGIAVAVHGQVEQMETTVSSLREGLWLAIAAVILLLVAAFQSLREPIAVLSTIPSVLAGVVIALSITNTPLDIQSMMGAITSIGVSVANAVLMVSYARDRRAAGVDRLEAATDAAAARLRPIAMTSLAMIAGMLPMALATGGGGEQSAPLGIAIIGGLVASTIATLVVLPAVDALLARRAYVDSSLLPDPVSPEGGSS